MTVSKYQHVASSVFWFDDASVTNMKWKLCHNYIIYQKIVISHVSKTTIFADFNVTEMGKRTKIWQYKLILLVQNNKQLGSSQWAWSPH